MLRDIVSSCQAVESAGIDAVWFSEHHFFDDSYLSSVFPLLGAVAARTSTLRIGTGILLAHFYNTLRLAEDAATVDLLSEGRFLLGLGHGWRDPEFEAFGVDKSGMGQRLEQIVGDLRDAWSADGALRGVAVTPKPYADSGVPLWLGGKSAAQCRRAGLFADGFITQSSRLEDISRDAALVAEGGAAADRSLEDFEFGLMLPIFPWDGADGWSEVRDGVQYVYAKYRQMADRVFTPPPADTPQRGVSTSATQELVTGDPESLAEIVSAAIAAAQAELPNSKIHVIARSWWPGLSPAVLERSAKVFAEQVAPAVLGN